MKKLFKNAHLITHTGEILDHLDILVVNDKIEQVKENLELDDGEIIDCSDKFIAPGFVVMHTHSPMNIFKGIAEDVNIDDWFNEEIWPYESKMEENDIYWGTKLACAEMINNGITAFCDHYFKSDIIAKACKECGIKADIAYTIFGFDGNCDEELKLAEDFVRKYQHDAYIQPRLGPHSPYICDKNVLTKIVEKAKELDCGIHIHISETKRQVEESKQNHHGQTPFDVLNECHGFDVPCILAHALWIEEEDLKYLNDSTCVAISPKTYMKLGMGMGNLWKYWKQIPLVSGNDGSASSNSINPVEQISLFALLGKMFDRAEEFTLEEMWQILMAGHHYLNFNSGKIEKGYSADFNIFDLSRCSTAPLYNPLASILYSTQLSTHICDTLIQGEFVKRNGQLVIDEKDIVAHANQCAKEIYRRGKGQSKLYF
ncbi:MAG: amidohydrolase family protein [Traorella sp.]